MRPLKILFLGAMAVGKSSLIRRVTKGEFDGDYKSTLGVQLSEIELELEGGRQKAILWDTDGEVEAAIFQSPYVKGMDAALIVCDASRPETGQVLIDIADAMQDEMPGRPFLGVINKTDIAAPSDQLRDAIEAACDYSAMTSALTGAGCDAALRDLVQLTIDRMDDL